ncbi:MAG TPA: hypothetical protein VHD90_21135 [Phototrophicaceae bacterium]|nr:hypothetical protein [Phototrophicaceae bacterium]
MDTQRQRRLRLIFDLIVDLGAAAFGLIGLIWLGYTYVAPGLRDKPFDTSLEGILGHTGTFIFLVIFSLAILIVGLFFAHKTILLLRNLK